MATKTICKWAWNYDLWACRPRGSLVSSVKNFIAVLFFLTIHLQVGVEKTGKIEHRNVFGQVDRVELFTELTPNLKGAND